MITPISPRVDFTWSPVSAPVSISVGGNTYPYSHQADGLTRPDDDRYTAQRTPVGVLITFTSDAEAFNDAIIVRYHWDFGDGTEGFGPVATKTYVVANPTTAVRLQVLDSNGLVSSAAHTLNLVQAAPTRVKLTRA